MCTGDLILFKLAYICPANESKCYTTTTIYNLILYICSGNATALPKSSLGSGCLILALYIR